MLPESLCVAGVAWISLRGPPSLAPRARGAGRPCWLSAVCLEVCAQLGTQNAGTGVAHL